jgi:hypothetical protein
LYLSAIADKMHSLKFVAVRMNLSFRTAMLIYSLEVLRRRMWPLLIFKVWTARHLTKRAPLLHMRKRDEYQSKVTEEAGLKRGRVPAPLLREMGARPGNRLIFRVEESGQVAMRLARVSKKRGRKRC